MEMIEQSGKIVLIDNQEAIGEITWSDANDVMIVDHTFVDSNYRGQGLAEQLVAAAVKKARTDGKKILPLCPFANKEFHEKPEYADIWFKQ